MVGLVLLAAVAQTPAPAWSTEPGSLDPGVSHAVIHSKANGVDVGYSLYLPPSYEKSKKRYPLVIFLHGAGGNELSDANGFAGVLEGIVDAKAFPESVILFPNGRMSGYRDHPDQKEFIETYLLDELLPYIEKTYRAGGSRNKRIISGFSMGGAGSCRLAFTHPNLFAGAVAWGGNGGREPGPTFDALKLNADKLRKNNFRLFMGVGEKDEFAQSEAFPGALTTERILFERKVLPGIGHDLGAYYRMTAEDGFRFVAPGIKAD